MALSSWLWLHCSRDASTENGLQVNEIRDSRTISQMDKIGAQHSNVASMAKNVNEGEGEEKGQGH